MTGEIVKPDAETLAEALDVWIPEYAEVLAQRDDMQMEPLEVVRDAARWALALLKGIDYEAAGIEVGRALRYEYSRLNFPFGVNPSYREIARRVVSKAIPGLDKLPKVVRQGELD